MNGLDVSKNYQSRLVELDINIVNNNYVIKAFCLPDITVSLDIAKIGKIVKIF